MIRKKVVFLHHFITTWGCLALTARMWECKHAGRWKQVP